MNLILKKIICDVTKNCKCHFSVLNAELFTIFFIFFHFFPSSESDEMME